MLSRLSVRRKNPQLTDTVVDALLRRIRQLGVLISAVPSSATLIRDPDDAHMLNLAIHAGARYLVSRDKDLLDLMDPTSEYGRSFREKHPRLVIIDPVEFLHEFVDR